MDIRFEDYLDEGTRKLLEIISSPDVGEEEMNAIVTAFSDELSSNVGDSSGLSDYESLLYGVSVNYIDSWISKIISDTNASYSDYESAIRLCNRQQKLLQLFDERKWKLPKLENVRLDKCEEVLRKRQESTSISSKIIEEDRQIDTITRMAQAELSVKTCNTILRLLNELDKNIDLCKQKKIAIPAINNIATKKAAKRITDLRKIAEQKEALHQSIDDVDLRIHSIVSLQRATPEQWLEVINLCQKQSELLSECNKKQWPLPSIRYDRPDGIANKYKQYQAMINLDRVILTERDSLSTNKQYKFFFSNCSQQQANIETCIRNGWDLPELAINDPTGIANTVHAEKSKRDKAKKLKGKLIMAGIIAICILALVFFGVHKYREGKVQIPFGASYVKGEDFELIYNELEKAGFENITKKPVSSGWQDSNKVIGVMIDNSESYSKGAYRKRDVSVVITYSNSGRKYVTDTLKGWKKADYETLRQTLENVGFTNVSVEEVSTSEKDEDKLTAALLLNGEEYTNERCYLPLDAPIVISYYALKIGIGNASTQFIGQDYETVVASLQESGFTNVQTQKINTGWSKGNTVVGVTVNNVDTYDSSECFAPDVKIVVKYSSDDRIDATATFENWQTMDYEALQSTLKAKGFTNITVTEKVTDDAEKNHLVSSIILYNEQFTAGDCYLQKASSIKIEYYALKITIGQTASLFEGEQYVDVVAELKARGFTNIQLQRANDLIIGWITKEGSIMTFSINGNGDFADTDTFYYDDQILIVVHTFKGKGCEDITVIAD